MEFLNLSRDYRQLPLKRGEKPPKEDIIYLYIELNLKSEDVRNYFNVGYDRFLGWLKFYEIKKSRKLVRAQTDRDYEEKHGEKLGTSKEVLEKRKKTMLEKYGVESYSQTNEYNKRVKETCLKRYGKENYRQTEECRERIKKTYLAKYGTEWFTQTEEMKKKSKQTNLKRYGTEYASQNNEIKEKTKQTNLEKYGYASVLGSKEEREKFKEKWIEKYGVDNPSKSEEIKEKIKQTQEDKHGCWASQTPEFRKKVEATCMKKFGGKSNFSVDIEKRKQTWIEKYGVDNPSKEPTIRIKGIRTCIEKYGVDSYTQTEEYKQICEENYEHRVQACYETKKKNNTFNKSQPEEEVYNKLIEKFMVTRQYKCERYPFACDFYLPDFDLFIEYKGSWTHCYKPFEGTEEDIEYLNKLKEKAKTSKFYENVIYTWTELDVRKLECVRKNNLNYLEFYNLEEFYNWFKLLD